MTLLRSTISGQRVAPASELEMGDYLDQQTFHELYERMPPGFRAELIGGVVHVPSPAKMQHAVPDGLLCAWLSCYRAATTGTEFLPNITAILGEDSEPQPDGALLIAGGQTHVREDDYLVGPPELVAEVASSTASYDLHSKKRDYERYGVTEYLVIVARQRRVVWFVRENGAFVEMSADAGGVLKSRVFPGLWLDVEAFLSNDYTKVLAVLQDGVKSDAHAEFVRKLAGT